MTESDRQFVTDHNQQDWQTILSEDAIAIKKEIIGTEICATKVTEDNIDALIVAAYWLGFGKGQDDDRDDVDLYDALSNVQEESEVIVDDNKA